MRSRHPCRPASVRVPVRFSPFLAGSVNHGAASERGRGLVIFLSVTLDEQFKAWDERALHWLLMRVQARDALAQAMQREIVALIPPQLADAVHVDIRPSGSAVGQGGKKEQRRSDVLA